MNSTGAIPVVSGTANGTTSWVLTSAVNAVGADAVTFTEFSLNPATVATLAANNAFTGHNTEPTEAQNDNSTKIATTAYVDRHSTLATGTSHTFAGSSDTFECTGTCTITMPTPTGGEQYCVRNANNVATVITISGLASVQYENTNFTSYKAANTSIVSGGAAGDKVCYVGKDGTHYDLFSFNGTWS
jgi:hypothetical protein